MLFATCARRIAVAVALTAAMALAGCAKNPADDLADGLGGGAGGDSLGRLRRARANRRNRALGRQYRSGRAGAVFEGGVN